MQLTAYLDRIGYQGSRAPTLATLRALHRAHLLAIPYENLDIHLGRRLVLDQRQIYEKIVLARRGGWCYEMNGLFAWALGELGYHVRLLAGTVGRSAPAARAEGNHLLLLVELDQPYLADVGFGNGFLEPLPLREGEHRQGFLSYHLSQTGARWLFQNHAYGGAGFDFTLDAYALGDFAERCHELQTAPDSSFVRLTVCHRFTPDRILSLRGAVLGSVAPDGVQSHTLGSADEYTATLREQFDLELAEGAALWEGIWASHLAWLEQQRAGQPPAS